MAFFIGVNMCYKSINSFPSYSISENGEIINNNKYHKKISKLTPRIRKDGYAVVSLSKNNKPKYFYVHRLVAQHFIPNPENKKYINHKDGDKSNNHIDNLEWCTASENSKHAIDNGLYEAPVFKGIDHGMAKITESQVKAIRQLYKDEIYNQVELSDIYDLGQSQIGRIIRRESWKHI